MAKEREKKPYRQLALGYQQGYPVDYMDLIKRRLPTDGADGASAAGSSSVEAGASNSSTTNNSIYNPAGGTATLTYTGGLLGLFGSGADGDLTLGSNTTIALQDDVVIKHYDDLNLAGYTLSIASGQACAFIFVNGTLNLGSGGVIRHAGNPYQTDNAFTSTSLYAVKNSAAGTVLGGNGGPPGGVLFVFARTITGSGTIHANGVAGDAGETSYGGGGHGGLNGTAPSNTQNNLFGRRVAAQNATNATAGTSTAPGNGGTASNAIGFSPIYDYYLAWYKNPWYLVNYFTNNIIGQSDTNFTRELQSNQNSLFVRGVGGYSGGGAPSSQTTTGGTNVCGAGGGGGGQLLHPSPGGNGGAGGAVGPGGWAETTNPPGDYYRVGAGGGGGGGGAGGFCVLVCAVNTCTSLTVSANGGAGGNGGAALDFQNGDPLNGGMWGSGGGGGGGGGGGLCVYNGPSIGSLTVSANGGAGGTGGAGVGVAGYTAGGTGVNGSTGTNGFAFNGAYTFSVTMS